MHPQAQATSRLAAGLAGSIFLGTLVLGVLGGVPAV
jgi:hypothetical protein